MFRDGGIGIGIELVELESELNWRSLEWNRNWIGIDVFPELDIIDLNGLVSTRFRKTWGIGTCTNLTHLCWEPGQSLTNLPQKPMPSYPHCLMPNFYMLGHVIQSNIWIFISRQSDTNALNLAVTVDRLLMKGKYETNLFLWFVVNFAVAFMPLSRQFSFPKWKSNPAVGE